MPYPFLFVLRTRRGLKQCNGQFSCTPILFFCYPCDFISSGLDGLCFMYTPIYSFFFNVRLWRCISIFPYSSFSFSHTSPYYFSRFWVVFHLFLVPFLRCPYSTLSLYLGIFLFLFCYFFSHLSRHTFVRLLSHLYIE